ncbi:hypothetical protein [Desulfosporosinus sp. BG]|uniref:hypothetical protein n=1 Tax=Desulfosporosinus sp. BG TaxID=1633135 RepID=UPI00083A68EC|nr:hypothetical protein [Desulfosporosinus sp. BG]
MRRQCLRASGSTMMYPSFNVLLPNARMSVYSILRPEPVLTKPIANMKAETISQIVLFAKPAKASGM